MRLSFVLSLIAGSLVAAPISTQMDALRQGDYGAFDEIVFAVRSNHNDGHWYANFGYSIQDEKSRCYGREGRLCALNIRTGAVRLLIDDPEGSVRDPVVSYDATKILFAYRKGETRNFHLYEIRVDGSGLTQLTDGPYDDIEPCYLPDGGIVFCSSRAKRWVNCWFTQVATIHRCNADGSGILMLSSNIEQDNTPWVLPNGRILYMRWEYVDRSRTNFHHLWTMNPDGTAHQIYFGNLHPGGVFLDAKPIPGSPDVIFIDSPGHGKIEHEGRLARVNEKAGPDALHNKRVILKAEVYRDPWAFADDFFMVAANNELRMANMDGEEAVFHTLPEEWKNAWLHEPRPIQARPREPVLPDRTNLRKVTGTFVLENIYEGRQMASVEKGTVKKLMILETLPKPVNFSGTMEPTSFNGTFTLPRILGFVPVEPDGSAHFTAPAMRPLFFIALDRDDRAVKRMQSFTQVMPGEMQGCVGCHEQRTQAPRSYLPGGRSTAANRPASQIDPTGVLFDVPDFNKLIQPILDRRCVKCHNPDDFKGRRDFCSDRTMFFTFGYTTLAHHRILKDGRDSTQSNYAPYKLGSGDNAFLAKGDGSHHDVTFTPGEIATIKQWLDASAVYAGTYAALGTGMMNVYGRPGITDVMTRRCDTCHATTNKDNRVSRKFDETFFRNLFFNFTRPGKSLFIRAPLATAAGGLGICTNGVFATTEDPDYQILLKEITDGAEHLFNAGKSYEMPGFRPNKQYIREMIRYGVLPPTFDVKDDPIDVFETDRKYWDLFDLSAGAQ